MSNSRAGRTLRSPSEVCSVTDWEGAGAGLVSSGQRKSASRPEAEPPVRKGLTDHGVSSLPAGPTGAIEACDGWWRRRRNTSPECELGAAEQHVTDEGPKAVT